MNIYLRRTLLVLLAALLGVGALLTPGLLQASDHDDGETDTKGRNLNLTDLYVFREINQAADPGSVFVNDLVFIMNTNPRSLARQQYFFSTNARYEFHIARVANVDADATGLADVTLRFEFGEPDGNNQQPITFSVVRADGTTTTQTVSDGSGPIVTTALNMDEITNELAVDNTLVHVFAGLREDPFFFDVEQFFRVRAGAAGIGPAVGFRDPGLDFTSGYNVNAIVVRVPRELLQASPDDTGTVFDVWETISVDNGDGTFTQVERLARPAVNEGLVLTNAFLNALNSVGPDFEAAALRGEEPAASIAGPIVGEVINTLKALGNSDERANALVGAFLPDVMRIETAVDSGYANLLNAKGSPSAGRLITDDVVDITLSVLTDGAITSDGVSYDGPNLDGRGHKPVLAEFPYLPEPN